jgi:phosphoglucomutase
VFTASHNAPCDHGLKVLDADGASAPREVTARIEAAAASALGRQAEAPAGPAGRPVELTEPYRRALVSLLRDGPLAGRRPRVVYDAMHGCGAGVLDAVLEQLGARVVCLRARRDLHFGGVSPDPLPERLAALRRQVAADSRAALGLATDGDADRYGVLDERGRPLEATQALALLVDHLARRGLASRGLAISIATGSLVERVAAHHGLPVTRHPIGFKYLSAALAAGADVAGEESGGFTLGAFTGDKDGVLAGALLAEVAAQGPLSRSLRALERRFGAGACGRRALAAASGGREALARLIAEPPEPPERVDGARILEVDRRDGLHLRLEDGFLMLRASGTEDVLRVYAEAPDRRRLARRLRAGEALLVPRVGTHPFRSLP